MRLVAAALAIATPPSVFAKAKLGPLCLDCKNTQSILGTKKDECFLINTCTSCNSASVADAVDGFASKTIFIAEHKIIAKGVLTNADEQIDSALPNDVAKVNARKGAAYQSTLPTFQTHISRVGAASASHLAALGKTSFQGLKRLKNVKFPRFGKSKTAGDSEGPVASTPSKGISSKTKVVLPDEAFYKVNYPTLNEDEEEEFDREFLGFIQIDDLDDLDDAFDIVSDVASDTPPLLSSPGGRGGPGGRGSRGSPGSRGNIGSSLSLGGGLGSNSLGDSLSSNSLEGSLQRSLDDNGDSINSSLDSDEEYSSGDELSDDEDEKPGDKITEELVPVLGKVNNNIIKQCQLDPNKHGVLRITIVLQRLTASKGAKTFTRSITVIPPDMQTTGATDCSASAEVKRTFRKNNKVAVILSVPFDPEVFSLDSLTQGLKVVLSGGKKKVGPQLVSGVMVTCEPAPKDLSSLHSRVRNARAKAIHDVVEAKEAEKRENLKRKHEIMQEYYDTELGKRKKLKAEQEANARQANEILKEMNRQAEEEERQHMMIANPPVSQSVSSSGSGSSSRSSSSSGSAISSSSSGSPIGFQSSYSSDMFADDEGPQSTGSLVLHNMPNPIADIIKRYGSPNRRKKNPKKTRRRKASMKKSSKGQSLDRRL